MWLFASGFRSKEIKGGCYICDTEKAEAIAKSCQCRGWLVLKKTDQVYGLFEQVIKRAAAFAVTAEPKKDRETHQQRISKLIQKQRYVMSSYWDLTSQALRLSYKSLSKSRFSSLA